MKRKKILAFPQKKLKYFHQKNYVFGKMFINFLLRNKTFWNISSIFSHQKYFFIFELYISVIPYEKCEIFQ